MITEFSTYTKLVRYLKFLVYNKELIIDYEYQIWYEIVGDSTIFIFSENGDCVMEIQDCSIFGYFIDDMTRLSLLYRLFFVNKENGIFKEFFEVNQLKYDALIILKLKPIENSSEFYKNFIIRNNRPKGILVKL